MPPVLEAQSLNLGPPGKSPHPLLTQKENYVPKLTSLLPPKGRVLGPPGHLSSSPSAVPGCAFMGCANCLAVSASAPHFCGCLQGG